MTRKRKLSEDAEYVEGAPSRRPRGSDGNINDDSANSSSQQRQRRRSTRQATRQAQGGAPPKAKWVESNFNFSFPLVSPPPERTPTPEAHPSLWEADVHRAIYIYRLLDVSYYSNDGPEPGTPGPVEDRLTGWIPAGQKDVEDYLSLPHGYVVPRSLVERYKLVATAIAASPPPESQAVVSASAANYDDQYPPFTQQCASSPPPITSYDEPGPPFTQRPVPSTSLSSLDDQTPPSTQALPIGDKIGPPKHRKNRAYVSVPPRPSWAPLPTRTKHSKVPSKPQEAKVEDLSSHPTSAKQLKSPTPTQAVEVEEVKGEESSSRPTVAKQSKAPKKSQDVEDEELSLSDQEYQAQRVRIRQGKARAQEEKQEEAAQSTMAVPSSVAERQEGQAEAAAPAISAEQLEEQVNTVVPAIAVEPQEENDGDGAGVGDFELEVGKKMDAWNTDMLDVDEEEDDEDEGDSNTRSKRGRFSDAFKKAGAATGVQIQRLHKALQRDFKCSEQQASAVTGYYPKTSKVCELTTWNIFLSCWALTNPAPKGPGMEVEHQHWLDIASAVYKRLTDGKSEDELTAFRAKLELAFISHVTKEGSDLLKKKSPKARINSAADIHRKTGQALTRRDNECHSLGFCLDTSAEGEAKSIAPVIWVSSEELADVLKSGKWPGKVYAQQLLTFLRAQILTNETQTGSKRTIAQVQAGDAVAEAASSSTTSSTTKIFINLADDDDDVVEIVDPRPKKKQKVVEDKENNMPATKAAPATARGSKASRPAPPVAPPVTTSAAPATKAAPATARGSKASPRGSKASRPAPPAAPPVTTSAPSAAPLEKTRTVAKPAQQTVRNAAPRTSQPAAAAQRTTAEGSKAIQRDGASATKLTTDNAAGSVDKVVAPTMASKVEVTDKTAVEARQPQVNEAAKAKTGEDGSLWEEKDLRKRGTNYGLKEWRKFERNANLVPWQGIIQKAFENRFTITNYPTLLLSQHPGSPGFNCSSISAANWKKLGSRLKKEDFIPGCDSSKTDCFRFTPWTEEQKAYQPDSAEWAMIPLVVAESGKHLTIVRDIMNTLKSSPKSALATGKSASAAAKSASAASMTRPRSPDQFQVGSSSRPLQHKDPRDRSKLVDTFAAIRRGEDPRMLQTTPDDPPPYSTFVRASVLPRGDLGPMQYKMPGSNSASHIRSVSAHTFYGSVKPKAPLRGPLTQRHSSNKGPGPSAPIPSATASSLSSHLPRNAVYINLDSDQDMNQVEDGVDMSWLNDQGGYDGEVEEVFGPQ
ncbi:hypothetical protein CVT26_002790 [Gymnopilus dilepis]|uniref:Uncharacterized protein n=1 Tax=Gymnopilus dilepis TaxID=231916 RepID=A0A409Y3E1_9AGAR|nr:hypothetical protein CVT26_002790 [Gymnopilus dilepis]